MSITEEQLVLARSRPLADVVRAAGIALLSVNGGVLQGRCPFCSTVAFHVSDRRGFFHCFECKESGSGIDFLMKHQGLSFEDAVHRLALEQS